MVETVVVNVQERGMASMYVFERRLAECINKRFAASRFCGHWFTETENPARHATVPVPRNLLVGADRAVNNGQNAPASTKQGE
ncbi:hypothetical protein CERZMDRAFT_90806 [Cercospora zeae-maydis SCOH1-5]|uniref:Uncharacterized protein n=1 Tax=Cercospora zeae-maydis SCOH1-5 TaxID=717836 RepID=A0A6A6FF01_9PEZI|nr:hypothetical protein CERZMDRAFT_90806 [Cercospora zeae-maydis SCOH1-5]